MPSRGRSAAPSRSSTTWNRPATAANISARGGASTANSRRNPASGRRRELRPASAADQRPPDQRHATLRPRGQIYHADGVEVDVVGSLEAGEQERHTPSRTRVRLRDDPLVLIHVTVVEVGDLATEDEGDSTLLAGRVEGDHPA